ncbi:MAG: bifunctional folylpolyglutamate synthase/dihydrofolate synthase, partial [Chloroflexaceae bacterium]|nr:bifunctional folylpolyglutamate synthase/dihydrofolate synthase [Chloroflexaceae bacterium]
PRPIPCPLPGTIQLTNSAIAVATLQLLKQQGFKIADTALQTGMAQTQWPGRLQWTTYGGQSLLLDGAHNAAAAIALDHYVRSLNKPVTWVMGMLATKDHAAIFQALLQTQDYLYLVPVPDHATADPQELATLALATCPNLRRCSPYPDLWPALDGALAQPERSIVLCGSLYLVGYFLKGATVSVLIPETH